MPEFPRARHPHPIDRFPKAIDRFPEAIAGTLQAIALTLKAIDRFQKPIDGIPNAMPSLSASHRWHFSPHTSHSESHRSLSSPGRWHSVLDPPHRAPALIIATPGTADHSDAYSSLADCRLSGKGQEDPMAIPRFAVRTLVSVLLFACAGLAACTSSPPTHAATADFNGAWSVQWCDKTDPDADCGGFDVELTQVGDKISGESFGARARLSQIDEGGVVHGIAIGNTAILTIESLRSGGIYLVEATIDGRCMQWKMRETVRKGERDIDIIAAEEVLTKAASTSPSNETELENDCRGIPIRRQD